MCRRLSALQVKDEGSGYHYNAVHRWYYDTASSMYYGGEPATWTKVPDIPEDAKYEAMTASAAPGDCPACTLFTLFITHVIHVSDFVHSGSSHTGRAAPQYVKGHLHGPVLDASLVHFVRVLVHHAVCCHAPLMRCTVVFR